jgi:pyruvate kinase
MEAMRSTKIIATVGPASSDPQVVRGMIAVGADVLRINCSHIDTATLEQRITALREIDPTVGILVDIQGPKLRFTGSQQILSSGTTVRFTHAELGLPDSASTGALSLAPGQRILLDDGRIETRITELSHEGPPTVTLHVEQGGELRKNKGVNLPDTEVVGSVLSAKDRADLEVARRHNVEYVAVSFVQRASDVEEVRDILGPTALVIAKIERPAALERLEDICRVSDGVMAARGDLGVELPYQIVPAAQHRIARTALRHGVTSICATEMLESMTSSSRATRAEVADVTGAVRDGFDAVMLSGETAVGVNPVRAVETMAAICAAAERDANLPVIFADANPERAAVTAAASSLARRIGADALFALTFTGYSARLLAACRPGTRIIAATPNESAARRLRLSWGVVPVLAPREPDVEVAISAALAEARTRDLVHSGDRIVVCASRLNPRSDADTIWLHIEP